MNLFSDNNEKAKNIENPVKPTEPVAESDTTREPVAETDTTREPVAESDTPPPTEPSDTTRETVAESDTPPTEPSDTRETVAESDTPPTDQVTEQSDTREPDTTLDTPAVTSSETDVSQVNMFDKQYEPENNFLNNTTVPDTEMDNMYKNNLNALGTSIKNIAKLFKTVGDNFNDLGGNCELVSSFIKLAAKKEMTNVMQGGKTRLKRRKTKSKKQRRTRRSKSNAN